MKLIWLVAALTCSSCSKESKNDPAPAAAPADKKSDATPNNAGVAKPEPVKKDSSAGASAVDVPGCALGVVPGSDHNLLVTREKDKGPLNVDFAAPGDRALKAIALYVTAPDDKIPTFKNNFAFSGTAYWMIASKGAPFDVQFQLPILYGVLPDKAVDATKTYQDKARRKASLTELTQATCLKFTVVTFEPDQVGKEWQTSSYLLPYAP